MTSSTRLPTSGLNLVGLSRNPSCSVNGMVLGRFLAYCTHPAAAWRRVPKGDRALIVAAYFGAGYLVTLAALIAA